jgi:hypothetical protein
MITRADQIIRAFNKFHNKNPRVWELFERYAMQIVDSGRGHYSAAAVVHRIRWHMEVETSHPEVEDGEHEESTDVKLNNNFIPHYARLFHTLHPRLDGFFRNRVLTSERREPFNAEPHECGLELGLAFSTL